MDEKIHAIKEWLGPGSINVFGPQFAGKDTQAKHLAEFLDGHMLSGGDILRESQNQALIQHINTGSLAPKDEFLQTVLPFLSNDTFAGKPLILSAVGRMHGEEPSVMEAAETSGHPLRAVLFLRLSAEQIWARWEAAQKLKDRGKRGDDTAETLKVRLKEFDEKTMPVIDFYRDKKLLIEVDGNPPPDDVTAAIIDRLVERATG